MVLLVSGACDQRGSPQLVREYPLPAGCYTIDIDRPMYGYQRFIPHTVMVYERLRPNLYALHPLGYRSEFTAERHVGERVAPDSVRFLWGGGTDYVAAGFRLDIKDRRMRGTFQLRTNDDELLTRGAAFHRVRCHEYPPPTHGTYKGPLIMPLVLASDDIEAS